ncbi:hypothetical protein O3P69_018624 [Scylla paramamosain]|uniref:Angiotensin-converting enzyme n=1 Tax=Scylla paramamosain TaxID=85552 RepID=A0AAW0T2E9_SCYPA
MCGMAGVRVGSSLMVVMVVVLVGGLDGAVVQVPRVRLPIIVKSFLEDVNERGSNWCTASLSAQWEYQTNVTEETRKAQNEALLDFAVWRQETGNASRTFASLAPLLPDDQRRQLRFLFSLGMAALPGAELEEYTRLKSEMLQVYTSARVCDFNQPARCDQTLSTDLSKMMKSSRDYQELAHVWRAWRDNTGRKMRPYFSQLVTLANKAAELNGFGSRAEQWQAKYNSNGNFTSVLSEIFQQLAPLYQQLHAYVRRKLREQYGETHISRKGPIPAHLLGSMWGQRWEDIYPLVKPYPLKASLDVTQEMKAQGYTVRKMFELADDFFVSLNMTRLPASFWRNSLFVRPSDRKVLCQASAWDFCNGKDYRVKMCAKVDMKDLLFIHHELGHIHYYLQYRHLPLVFRKGANQGFHEALGDTIIMSVGTPRHLQKVGLLKEVEEDPEVEMNYLLRVALRWVPLLHFAYVLDLWRWEVFSGQVPEYAWNCAWWELRFQLQGLKPPVVRTEKDFDPAAKYHVVADVEYIRYYVSTVLQFQFYKALCMKAGQYDPLDPSQPLHKCDFYQSYEAGNTLKNMLKLGRSRPWEEALGVLTGETEGRLDASAMREYFKPLEEWLAADNKMHDEHIGWQSDGEYCRQDSLGALH